MNDNHKLEMLPEGFGGLKSLVDLHIGNNSIQQGGFPSDFGGLSALTRLQLQYNYMVTLPEGLKELQALVYLEMHHCPNLVDVQGLPWSLEDLDLGDCPKLIDIPSLRNLHLLKSLILCNCTSLTQLQDLDSLNTLKRVNLSGCTMLQNVPNLNHNGALEACYLSGSYISMPIDSDWLKVRFKPEIELHFFCKSAYFGT
jgi:Leucine-rich repeat (LRR) protein